MKKQDKIDKFNPNERIDGGGIYGLPFNYEESETVVLGVPWSVTQQLKGNAALAPKAVLEASRQVELFDPYLPEGWKKGIYYAVPDKDIYSKHLKFQPKAARYLKALHKGEPGRDWIKQMEKINKACAKMVDHVQQLSTAMLKDDKNLIVLGGDQSTALGLLRSLAQRYEAFGLLHIDAHADLSPARKGFTYSHQSFIHNTLRLKPLKKVVQVGVREYNGEEHSYIQESHGRVITFFDREIKRETLMGKSWIEQCKEMVDSLPDKVYLSLDIDGLMPYLCPGTAEPVPGGLQLDELYYLLEQVVESGRTLIGADLCEIGAQSGEQWDARVGARLLYRIVNYMLASR